MITEKLKKKVLQALEDKKKLEFAKHNSSEAQQALSMADAVWKRTQMELLNEIESFDRTLNNHIFSIDGKVYLVISGYGNPVNVDVQERVIQEWKERTTERTVRDSIT